MAPSNLGQGKLARDLKEGRILEQGLGPRFIAIVSDFCPRAHCWSGFLCPKIWEDTGHADCF